MDASLMPRTARRGSVARAASTRTRIASVVVGAAAGVTIAATPALALPGQWSLWASASQNGFQAGTFPCLAISKATNELYYSWQFAGPTLPAGAPGKVWRCDLADPTHTFNLLPQTGFVLPPPSASNPQNNVQTMTTNAAGEPVVGLAAPGNPDGSKVKMYRYDKATQAWVAPTLSLAAGATVPLSWPTQAAYNMAKGPNGTIWVGGQWGHVFRSGDGGKSFTLIDESALLKASHPDYFPTRAAGTDNLGAVYGINVDAAGRVYIGTETGGGVYTADNGVTWHPFDNDYTNPNSPMARITSAGNIAGIGFTKDGKVVFQGTQGGNVTTPVDDGVHLWLVDPANHTVQSAQGFSPYFLGGQTVDQIVTTASGQMFFHSNNSTVKPDGTPTAGGGIYTSSDGLHWTQFNAGLEGLVVQLSNGTYYDLNGKGSAGSFAVDGDTVYYATQDGRIWTYTVPEPGVGLIALALPLVLRRRRGARGRA